MTYVTASVMQGGVKFEINSNYFCAGFNQHLCTTQKQVKASSKITVALTSTVSASMRPALNDINHESNARNRISTAFSKNRTQKL